MRKFLLSVFLLACVQSSSFGFFENAHLLALNWSQQHPGHDVAIVPVKTPFGTEWVVEDCEE